MESLPFLGPEPPSGTAEKKQRGRPKGAKNKASGDLAKWFAHKSGSTPGQQLIELVAVTPKDIRLAKQWAKDRGTIIFKGEAVDLRAFAPRALGMVWKAHNLALLNKWDLDYAWAMMYKGIDMLMPYVHQKQGAAEPEKADTRPAIYMQGVALGSQGNPSQGLDYQEELRFGPMPATQALPHMDGKA